MGLVIRGTVSRPRRYSWNYFQKRLFDPSKKTIPKNVIYSYGVTI